METTASTSMSPASVARSISRRRRVTTAALLVACACVLSLIVIRIAESDSGRLFASSWKIALAFAGLAGAYVAAASWGCPRCATSLGLWLHPWYCNGCGASLRGESDSPGSSVVPNPRAHDTRTRVMRLVLVFGVLVVAASAIGLFMERRIPAWVPWLGLAAVMVSMWLRSCSACGASQRTISKARFCSSCGRPPIRIT